MSRWRWPRKRQTHNRSAREPAGLFLLLTDRVAGLAFALLMRQGFRKSQTGIRRKFAADLQLVVFGFQCLLRIFRTRRRDFLPFQLSAADRADFLLTSGFRRRCFFDDDPLARRMLRDFSLRAVAVDAFAVMPCRIGLHRSIVVIMRWLRRSTDHASPYMRYMSGATVLSSSMTSAPCSANSSQTNGAAMTAPALSTFKFCKLPNLGRSDDFICAPPCVLIPHRASPARSGATTVSGLRLSN